MKKKDTLFAQAIKSLKKFKGDLISEGEEAATAIGAIKLEPSLIVSQEDVMYTNNNQYSRARIGIGEVDIEVPIISEGVKQTVVAQKKVMNLMSRQSILEGMMVIP